MNNPPNVYDYSTDQQVAVKVGATQKCNKKMSARK